MQKSRQRETERTETARAEIESHKEIEREKEEKKERGGIKETTTEAQSPLSPLPPLLMMVGCGVVRCSSGTTSYSTAPL